MPSSRTAYGNAIQAIPGTLRGYRVWRRGRDWRFLGLHNTGLLSLNGFAWNNDPGPAECAIRWYEGRWMNVRNSEDHPAPFTGCSCGYYAAYEPDGYKDYMPSPLHEAIHGCIKAYGRISLGERGFRARYVRVEAVYGFGARAVARRYDVPWFRNKNRMLARFPPQDVTELLQ